jgi:hypothetical protein
MGLATPATVQKLRAALHAKAKGAAKNNSAVLA